MELRFDIEQNTDEWYSVKIGKFSASTAADLLMDKKNKGYVNLINKIIEERITGDKSESSYFTGNKYTERGHEFEPIAAVDYELRTLTATKTIGVIIKDEWTLCSPDRLIGDNKLQQIKCPIFNTQRSYWNVLNKHRDSMTDNEIMQKISSSYYKQMQFELFVSERDVNVFTSYHPKLKPIDLDIRRDNKIIADIELRLNEAKKEVLEQINLIKQL